MGWIRDLRAVWKTVLIIITPIVFIPLALPETSQESKCSYVLAIMAVFCITEALPLPVTALLPVILLPLLGIMASKRVVINYFKDVVVLLLGGLMVAIAIEESNLHKRFALRLLLLLGVQPRKLLMGFMLSTGFLSMWITNTATTAMMTPIARALLARLFKAQRQNIMETRQLGENETTFSWPVENQEEMDITTVEQTLVGTGEDVEILIGPKETNGTTDNKTTTQLDTDIQTSQRHQNTCKGQEATENNQPNDGDKEEEYDDNDDDDDDKDVNLDMKKLDEGSRNLVKGLCLSVCYSANIGGVGTLTGTMPNIVFKNYVDTLSKGEVQVSFVSWMAFGAPIVAINLVLTWFWLQLFFFGVKNTLLCRNQTRPEEDEALTHYLRREHRKLGNMSFAEKVVLLHFLVLVALWLTRSPGIFPGWSIFFEKGYVSDAVPAVLVAISLFIFPRERPAILCCKNKNSTKPYKRSPSILQWTSLSRKFPWGVLLLLGGGFALADATSVSGLSNLIAEQLMVIGSFPAWVACVIVVVVTSITTEITSNTVIATLLLPILAQVAGSMQVHPIYFMLPSAVASSFAFMLPVATPPNAIVFAHGDIKVLDMIKTDVALNIICIAVVTLAINTFGYAYFQLDKVPDWAAFLTQTTPTLLQNGSMMMTNDSTSVMNIHEQTTVPFLHNISSV